MNLDFRSLRDATQFIEKHIDFDNPMIALCGYRYYLQKFILIYLERVKSSNLVTVEDNLGDLILNDIKYAIFEMINFLEDIIVKNELGEVIISENNVDISKFLYSSLSDYIFNPTIESITKHLGVLGVINFKEDEEMENYLMALFFLIANNINVSTKDYKIFYDPTSLVLGLYNPITGETKEASIHKLKKSSFYSIYSDPYLKETEKLCKTLYHVLGIGFLITSQNDLKYELEDFRHGDKNLENNLKKLDEVILKRNTWL